MDELTCKELVELVTEYLDGAMPPGERARFEEHIAACPGCGTYLDHMRRTVEMLGRLTPESLPPEAERELLHAFQDWKRR